MKLRALVPRPIKAYIKGQLRRRKVRAAMGQLSNLDAITRANVDAFGRAWENEGFAADPDYLWQLARLLKKGPVLECGTGATTVLAHQLGELYGFSSYSLEQDMEWGRDVLNFVDAKIIPAPLKDFGGWSWYDFEVDLPRHFGLIICDGPFIDKELPNYEAWRYGLLPWLKRTRRTFDMILLDDLNDARAEPIVTRWEAEFGLSVERISSPQGICGILRPSDAAVVG